MRRGCSYKLYVCVPEGERETENEVHPRRYQCPHVLGLQQLLASEPERSNKRCLFINPTNRDLRVTKGRALSQVLEM